MGDFELEGIYKYVIYHSLDNDESRGIFVLYQWSNAIAYEYLKFGSSLNVPVRIWIATIYPDDYNHFCAMEQELNHGKET